MKETEYIKGDAKTNDTPLQPNMLVIGASAVSSTFTKIDMSHSVLSANRHFNSRFHESNFEGCAFNSCDFDGTTFAGCSFRAVEFVNCDIEKLVVNGINIGNLLKIATGSNGAI